MSHMERETICLLRMHKSTPRDLHDQFGREMMLITKKSQLTECTNIIKEY